MDNFKRSLLTGSTVICVKGTRATRCDELPKFEFNIFNIFNSSPDCRYVSVYLRKRYLR